MHLLFEDAKLCFIFLILCIYLFIFISARKLKDYGEAAEEEKNGYCYWNPLKHRFSSHVWVDKPNSVFSCYL